MRWLVGVCLKPFPPARVDIVVLKCDSSKGHVQYFRCIIYLHILRAVCRTSGPSALLLITIPSTRGVARFILPTWPASLTLINPLARGWRKITRQTVLIPGTKEARGTRSASSRLSNQMRTTFCSCPPPEGPPLPGFLDLVSSPTSIERDVWFLSSLSPLPGAVPKSSCRLAGRSYSAPPSLLGITMASSLHTSAQ